MPFIIEFRKQQPVISYWQIHLMQQPVIRDSVSWEQKLSFSASAFWYNQKQREITDTETSICL